MYIHIHVLSRHLRLYVTSHAMCVYVCVNTHANSLFIRTYIDAYTYMFMFIYILYTHTHIHINIYIHIYTFICIYNIYTHAHTQ